MRCMRLSRKSSIKTNLNLKIYNSYYQELGSSSTSKQSTKVATRLKISRKSLPKSQNQLKNYRVPLDREFEQLRDPLQGCSTASTRYQSKEQVSGIPAPRKSLKSSAENGGNLRNICSVDVNSRNLLAKPVIAHNKIHTQQPDDVFSKETSQNDIVPTNSNDVAELHQLVEQLSCFIRSESTVQGEHHGFSDLVKPQIIYLSGVVLFDTLSEIASSFITNALQVNFDSVLGIQNIEGMVQMFRALEATGLRDFLGCPSNVSISEDRFAGVFNLPTDGLTDLSKVPNDLVLPARTLFSKTSVPVQFSCKKRLMKYEFCLLNNILAKSITVKAGSFDAVNHKRFLMMTVIHFGIKVNWSITVKAGSFDANNQKSQGFCGSNLCSFERQPCGHLGRGEDLPSIEIISAKTMNTYIATNKTIDARGESDEPDVAKVAIVKKKSVSKKKSASIADKDADDVHMKVVAEKAVLKKRPAAVFEATVVKKKRTTSGKALSILMLRSEKAPKRKLRMTAGSDDEIVEEEPAVENIPGDAMLPSVLAAEPTKIKFGLGIQIPGVHEVEQYKANLPQIPATENGKEPLVVDTIQGHPARENFSLICADIDFLIQLREQVIEAVAAFFNSFSVRILPALGSLEAIAAKEEKVLTWGETDLVQTALLQLVMDLTQLVELQEVVRVSQLRITYLYVSVQLARGMPGDFSLYSVDGV
ncbi:hypothetical protein F511_16955 [Dorcoceras hygrometricum]|uniref:Uncharacterized protein n=1 Tax=Dorcoceras hygrometricum TaxID=472368 RepID=A0A2Z7D3X6_9LAMI|nr:hypothetical protein F511_16955 [Dorcoceras hygrometricum]